MLVQVQVTVYRRMRIYAPQSLCFSVSMFPGSLFPSLYVPQSYDPQYLCSPVPMFPGLYVSSSYVPQ